MNNDLMFAEQAGLLGPSSRVGESHAAAQRFAELIRADEREVRSVRWDELIAKAVESEREACAKEAGEFARKWWSIHCASNKHMETTRKAHDDFCALEVAIRARGTP